MVIVQEGRSNIVYVMIKILNDVEGRVSPDIFKTYYGLYQDLISQYEDWKSTMSHEDHLQLSCDDI